MRIPSKRSAELSWPPGPGEPGRELAERLGWTAKHLLSQARPAVALDLAELGRTLAGPTLRRGR